MASSGGGAGGYPGGAGSAAGAAGPARAFNTLAASASSSSFGTAEEHAEWHQSSSPALDTDSFRSPKAEQDNSSASGMNLARTMFSNT